MPDAPWTGVSPGLYRYSDLQAIIQSNREQNRDYQATPPDACPNDGTPLVQNSRGVRDCPMGDYTYTGGPRLT